MISRDIPQYMPPDVGQVVAATIALWAGDARCTQHLHFSVTMHSCFHLFPGASAGTSRPLPRFYGMRIREENCNMILLAVVTSISVAIAGGAALVEAADNKPVRIADRSTGRIEQTVSPDKRIIYVSDAPPVRTVGAPFVPNTNPRER